MHANNLGAALCWLVAAMTMTFPASPARAQEPAVQFDKPVSTRTHQANNDAPKIICTAYADVMVRETQDGPTSENAMLLRGANDLPADASEAVDANPNSHVLIILA